MREEEGRQRLEELRFGDAVPTPGIAKEEQRFPEWFDPKKFQKAKDVYRDHFASVNFGHLCGLLLSFYFTKNIETLRSTGESESRESLFRRYLSTVRHVRRWYEGDVWEPADPARRSLNAVRGMHARVAARMNKDGDSVYVSQWDMAITQWAFIGTLVVFREKVGLHGASDTDLEALVHFWRCIGWLLGVEDAHNLCAGGLEDVEATCLAMLREEYAVRVSVAHPESVRMVCGVVEALRLLDPTLSSAAMQAYCRDLVGLPPSTEDQKMCWADWTCHALTSLVMRHALQYDAPRLLLNRLTRWRLDAADKAAEKRIGVTGG